jgi:hypothetical protein
MLFRKLDSHMQNYEIRSSLSPVIKINPKQVKDLNEDMKVQKKTERRCLRTMME